MLNSLLLSKYYRLLFISAALLLICFIFCPLDETVNAEGQIRPAIQESEVKSPLTGVISDVFYTNTQYVNMGDVLFCIDCDYEIQSVKELMKLSLFYEEILNQYLELIQLLDITTIYECNYSEKAVETNPVYSSFILQYLEYKNEQIVKSKYYEMQINIASKELSIYEQEVLKNETLKMKSDFENWINSQKAFATEKYMELFEKNYECKQAIITYQQVIDNSCIRAKVSGYINEFIKISKGDSISKDSVVSTIIPLGESLKAIINIKNSSISKIKVGQDVVLKINDLPYTEYTKLVGKIILIPSDVVAQNGYFPIEVEIHQTFLSSKQLFEKEEQIPLKIGAKVDATVIVSKDSLLKKLIRKVLYEKD